MKSSGIPERVRRADAFENLPPDWPDDPLPAIQDLNRQANAKIVVLDDDPTGSQMVWGVPVLTEWNLAVLCAELQNDLPACFLLTNTRSLLAADAERINAEIGRNLAEASRQTGRPYVVVSRGDSTLRGHFPGEVQALAHGTGLSFDAWLLVPMLAEAGRYTLHDIHYAAEGEWLVPVGQTAYARDATFGYRASNLREWVEEKTGGRILAGQVQSISLDELRQGGPDAVLQRLNSLPESSVCIINAVTRRDLEVFTAGLLRSEACCRRFLVRSGPAFLPVRLGLAHYPLLRKQDIPLPEEGGGLVVIGSYVPATTTQVQALLARGEVRPIEVQVEALLEPGSRQQEIARAASQAEDFMRRGEDTVIYTSRGLVTGSDPAGSLAIGQQVSSALVSILRAVQVRPRYVLAKGGITSSDVATGGLGVKRGMVLGQILPDVSVWQLCPSSRYPDLIYIVFPGNVGGPQAVADVVSRLRRNAPEITAEVPV